MILNWKSVKMMLSEVKSKAPNGATHFVLHGTTPTYYMQSGQQNFVYDSGIWRVVNINMSGMTKL
jgi:hypothetical protein